MKTFEQHCEEAGVGVFSRDAFLKIYAKASPSYCDKLRESSRFNSHFTVLNFESEPRKKLYDRVIIVGDSDPVQHECSKWHELGHAMHPKGTPVSEFEWYWYKALGEFNLEYELNADAWALKNYAGDYVVAALIPDLRRCILTYIRDGYRTAHDTTDTRYAARMLDIEHLIEWVD